MTTQPEALRLADVLSESNWSHDRDAAAELRRLHADLENSQRHFDATMQAYQEEIKINKALLEALTLIAGAENSALDLARCKGIARAAIDISRSKK